MKCKNPYVITAALFSIVVFSSCVTTKKFDAYVSSQYNDQVPEINTKKKTSNISVSSPLVSNAATVSTTTANTKMLPLLVYWNINHRFVCALNPQIAVANFSKAVNTMGNKGLNETIKGGQLELTVEQAPAAFSMVDKTNVVWVIYAIHWTKVYIEPDRKDLVVSYKLHLADSTVKTGSITIKNKEQNQNLRFFQSWKSATSEYIATYDQDVTAMTKEFVNKLMEELKQKEGVAQQ